MRAQMRNRQKIYHSEYSKKSEPIKDEYGNETGEYQYAYSEPQEMKINISPPTGEVSSEAFGGIENYDAILLTYDKKCPISENSRIWFGIEPMDSVGNAVAHNYEVVKASPSLNVLRYAISKVKIDG